MRALLLLPLPLLLAACAFSDPYERPGTWRPSGANEANLRTMLANPAHLERGVAGGAADGALAAAAVERLRQDKVKPLPESTIARIGATGSP